MQESAVHGEPFGGVYPERSRRAQDRLVKPERLFQARIVSGEIGDFAALWSVVALMAAWYMLSEWNEHRKTLA